jgi:protein gp37
MAETSIEWTRGDDGSPGAVWNPTTGCDKVSAGCGLPRWPGDDTGGCYAMAMAKRLKAMGQAKYQTDGDPRTSGPGFGLAVHEDALTIPLQWRKPRRIFVNSMSDLWHAKVPREFVARVFAVMAATPRHTYQILTKRPERMARMLSSVDFYEAFEREFLDLTVNRRPELHRDQWSYPLPNAWLGTSLEMQDYAESRLRALRATPAAVRWVSAEPLLGPVDLGLFTETTACTCSGYCPPYYIHEPGCGLEPGPMWGALDWVVVGGESGADARPMDLDWARSIVQQCRTAGVPVFVKQLGIRWGRNHHDISRFPPELQVREYPEEVSSGR